MECEYALCAYHGGVTLAALGLVCYIFFPGSQLSHQAHTEIFSPVCARGGCAESPHWGEETLVRGPATGLFSNNNAPVMCLTAQFIAACLAVSYAPVAARDRLTKGAFGVLGAYGVALLFLRDAWQIPGNNLIWFEIMVVFAMMCIAPVPLTASAELPRIIGGAFSVPMLCVATLVATGEGDAVSLRIAYAGTMGVSLLWLMEHLRDDDEEDAGLRSVEEGAIAMRATPWLCLLPFVIVACLRLDQLSVVPAVQWWALMQLGLLLTWVLCIMLYFTFFDACWHHKPGGHSLVGQCLYALHLMAQGGVVLLLLCAQFAR